MVTFPWPLLWYWAVQLKISGAGNVAPAPFNVMFKFSSLGVVVAGCTWEELDCHDLALAALPGAKKIANVTVNTRRIPKTPLFETPIRSSACRYPIGFDKMTLDRLYGGGTYVNSSR